MASPTVKRQTTSSKYDPESRVNQLAAQESPQLDAANVAVVMASPTSNRQTTSGKCHPESRVNKLTVQDLQEGDVVDVYSQSAGRRWLCGSVLKKELDLLTVEYETGGTTYQKQLRLDSRNIRVPVQRSRVRTISQILWSVPIHFLFFTCRFS